MKIIKTEELYQDKHVYLVENRGKQQKHYLNDDSELVPIKIDKDKLKKEQEKENITVSTYDDEGNMVEIETAHAVRELVNGDLIGCHEYLKQDEDKTYFALALWQWWRGTWKVKTYINLDPTDMNVFFDTMTDMGWLK